MGKAVRFVNAVNAGLALGGVALAALAAVGGALVALSVVDILKGGAA